MHGEEALGVHIHRPRGLHHRAGRRVEGHLDRFIRVQRRDRDVDLAVPFVDRHRQRSDQVEARHAHDPRRALGDLQGVLRPRGRQVDRQPERRPRHLDAQLAGRLVARAHEGRHVRGPDRQHRPGLLHRHLGGQIGEVADRHVHRPRSPHRRPRRRVEGHLDRFVRVQRRDRHVHLAIPLVHRHRQRPDQIEARDAHDPRRALGDLQRVLCLRGRGVDHQPKGRAGHLHPQLVFRAVAGTYERRHLGGSRFQHRAVLLQHHGAGEFRKIPDRHAASVGEGRLREVIPEKHPESVLREGRRAKTEVQPRDRGDDQLQAVFVRNHCEETVPVGKREEPPGRIERARKNVGVGCRQDVERRAHGRYIVVDQLHVQRPVHIRRSRDGKAVVSIAVIFCRVPGTGPPNLDQQCVG